MSWKKINYLRHGETNKYDHQIWLPEPLANWDVYDYWEKERDRSMESKLNKNDILFDIGAESGWMSVVFAKFCKVFLIEPTKEFWANIYQTWIKNRTEMPIGFFSGLIGKETNITEFPEFDKFPHEILDEMIDKNKYQYIHQHSDDIKMMSLDDLVKESGVTPTALTIDVEGGEFDVLIGGSKTLLENNLKVWVSIHPDLLEKDYDNQIDGIHQFMKERGYLGVHLATDHEEHWFYEKS